MKLDEKRPYGTVYGHLQIKFTQDGKNYNANKREIGTEEDPEEESTADPLNGELITDQVNSAADFLKQILSEGPVAKAVVYREAENNNQGWEDVKKAFAMVGIIKIMRKQQEFWKLPEYVG